MRIIVTALAAAAATAALASPAAAEGRWETFKEDGRCWAASAPEGDAPGAFASVQNLPAEEVRNSVAVVSGNAATGEGDVELTVDGKSFDMLPFEAAAFARSGAPEASLISAMRRGKEMTVKWVAQDGKSVEHRYSLIGFTDAIRAVDAACK